MKQQEEKDVVETDVGGERSWELHCYSKKEQLRGGHPQSDDEVRRREPAKIYRLCTVRLQLNSVGSVDPGRVKLDFGWCQWETWTWAADEDSTMAYNGG